ncbi:hypothetical protein MHLP_03635 [Candidatus Mycoplasma haematolamae str. Purdue]|uniref:Metallothionein n=1 Tax=Mycoplasma haematolamae (strain Purdue) TaxID=1212765 RepID=I7C6X8_MYCHA|nr:hypothetical protein MHLP_03635 [Candidatus Mycoplasma haematolamae str. Purdue]
MVAVPPAAAVGGLAIYDSVSNTQRSEEQQSNCCSGECKECPDSCKDKCECKGTEGCCSSCSKPSR